MPASAGAARLLGHFASGKQALGLVSLLQDFVDQAELLSLLSSHEVIAVKRFFNYLIAALRMLDIDFVQAPFHLDDVFGMPLDVAGLALEPAGRLVHHDTGIGERVAQARGSRA